jgi:hypothetical protein
MATTEFKHQQIIRVRVRQIDSNNQLQDEIFKGLGQILIRHNNPLDLNPEFAYFSLNLEATEGKELSFLFHRPLKDLTKNGIKIVSGFTATPNMIGTRSFMTEFEKKRLYLEFSEPSIKELMDLDVRQGRFSYT